MQQFYSKKKIDQAKVMKKKSWHDEQTCKQQLGFPPFQDIPHPLE